MAQSSWCDRVECCALLGTYPCTIEEPTYGCQPGDCCAVCIHPDDPAAAGFAGGCGSVDCPPVPTGPRTCECISMTCCAMAGHHPRLTPDCTCGPITQAQKMCTRTFRSIKPRVEKYGDYTLLINQNSMVADWFPGTCDDAPPPLNQLRGCNPSLNQLCACPSPYAPTIS